MTGWFLPERSFAIGAIKDNLWVGYVGENLNNLYVIPYDGKGWGDQVQVGDGAQTNNVAPALTIWDITLWMAFVGKNKNNLYVISYDGSNWGKQIQVGGGGADQRHRPGPDVLE